MVKHSHRTAGATFTQRGWVLLALLFMLAALGAGMAALGTVWTTVAQREREAELLFVGEQYRRAIESYQQRGPGSEKPYPPSLEALLQDRRFPMPVRHLRRLYPDPMTGRPEWGLVRDAQGGIVGVYSLSDAQPLRTTGFTPQQEGFAEASTYRDWVFRAQASPRTSGREATIAADETEAGVRAGTPRGLGTGGTR